MKKIKSLYFPKLLEFEKSKYLIFVNFGSRAEVGILLTWSTENEKIAVISVPEQLKAMYFIFLPLLMYEKASAISFFNFSLETEI